jgi:hypothetical protein
MGYLIHIPVRLVADDLGEGFLEVQTRETSARQSVSVSDRMINNSARSIITTLESQLSVQLCNVLSAYRTQHDCFFSDLSTGVTQPHENLTYHFVEQSQRFLEQEEVTSGSTDSLQSEFFFSGQSQQLQCHGPTS